jgi:DNA repair exonuclease SbcCD ATPase subunit
MFNTYIYQPVYPKTDNLLGVILEKNYNHITRKHMCAIMSINDIITKSLPTEVNLIQDPANSSACNLLNNFFNDLEHDLDRQSKNKEDKSSKDMLEPLQLEAILGNFIVMTTANSPVHIDFLHNINLIKFIDKNLLEFIKKNSKFINIDYVFGCTDSDKENLSLPILIIKRYMILTLEYCFKNLPLSIHNHNLLSNIKNLSKNDPEYKNILDDLYNIYYKEPSAAIYSNMQNMQSLKQENEKLKAQLEKIQFLEQENKDENIKDENIKYENTKPLIELEKIQSLEQENKNLKIELEKIQSLEQENKNLKIELEKMQSAKKEKKSFKTRLLSYFTINKTKK